MTHDLDHDLRALDPTSRTTNGPGRAARRLDLHGDDDLGRPVVDCMMQLNRGLIGNLLGVQFSRGGGGLTQLPPEPPAPDQIEAATFGGVGGDSDVAVLSTSGRAGAQVRSVVAHTPTTGDVQATVRDGFWAAWWPAEMDGAQGPEMDGLSFTVTLRDSSTFEATYEDVAARIG